MRLCGMVCAAWSRFQPCLLVLMTVVPTILSRGGCPADVPYETNQCLSTYTVHVYGVGDGGAFYSGIDVENIRAVCTALKQAMRCVIGIKDSCPENSHSQIMTVVDGPLINMYELCHVERIYELYSRHQFCYSRIKSGSKECSDEFESQTSHLRDRLSSNDPHAQKEYCRHFDRLTSCVENNVKRNCGEEAATLTEKLVRASHGRSQSCEDGPATTTTQPTIRPAVRSSSADGWKTANTDHEPVRTSPNDAVHDGDALTTVAHVGRTAGDEKEQYGARAHGAAVRTSRLSLSAAALVLASTIIVNAASLCR